MKGRIRLLRLVSTKSEIRDKAKQKVLFDFPCSIDTESMGGKFEENLIKFDIRGLDFVKRWNNENIKSEEFDTEPFDFTLRNTTIEFLRDNQWDFMSLGDTNLFKENSYCGRDYPDLLMYLTSSNYSIDILLDETDWAVHISKNFTTWDLSTSFIRKSYIEDNNEFDFSACTKDEFRPDEF